jgi:TonB family protein
VSLEQYKTQVLLLHSEQSTLDTLSAGFSDRYSVHCATSGTEALNTLGDTPIHVFVSAQELPGMSGLDAIREAKKRSPSTIGILLAGNNKQDGLEALVGIKEVFQVIRGKIEPEDLLELIESATNQSSTKSMRLLALAESANDHKADVDEPISEHIVMETSENGSAIISDGTGTLPVLRPGKISLAPGVGGREVDVLVLTKDEEFLATIKDSARGLHNVYHALTPTQAEDIVRDNKVGVLVTDAAMVGSNIEGLTQRLRAKRARIVAIVAGRRDDGELLMDLINRGHVYRFLLKPVSPGRARLAIEASVKHHMEAPDEAFKPKTQPAQIAAKSAPAPAPKAPEKPRAAVPQTPRPTPKPERKNEPQAIAKPKPSPKPAAPIKKIEPTISSARIEPTIETDLDSTFGDTSSFTDTMTDIAAFVGKSISDAKDSVAGSAKGLIDSVGTAPSPLQNKKLLAIGGGAIAALAVVAWLVLGGDSTIDDVASDAVVDSAPATSESTSRDPAPVQEELRPETAAVQTTDPAAALPYAALLEEARAARDAGNLITPAGDSALELYVATVAEAANDAVVVAEFNDVVSRVLGIAESAILARNVDQAETSLEMARLADPRNSRLTFLTAQLKELQLNDTATQARLAIRQARFEDASALISEAQSLSGNNTTEVTLLAEELRAARVRQQVGDTIALANERLDAGTLISPANDSARHYFQQALMSDPENQAAQQGLITIASKLVLRAREAIDSGELDNADTLLASAASLDPTSTELSAANAALADAREAIAENARRAEAERQAELKRQQEAARLAEADRVAELERQREATRQAEAERVAELQRQQEAARQAEIDRQAKLEQQAAEQRQAEALREAEAKQREADRIVAKQREVEAAAMALDEAEKQANRAATASPLGVGAAAPANPRPAPDTSSRAQSSAKASPVPEQTIPVASTATGATTFRLPQADATDSGTTQQTTVAANNAQRPAPEQQPPVTTSATSNNSRVEPELVAVSTLTRTNYVGPEYPRSARRRNITGSVDVQFTVTTDGRVRSMSIVQSEPGDTFDQAAMDAVEQWRFEPVIENGAAVEKRTAVRLAFDLQ